MSEEERTGYKSKIMANRETVQRFRAVLSDAPGNRKKQRRVLPSDPFGTNMLSKQRTRTIRFRIAKRGRRRKK